MQNPGRISRREFVQAVGFTGSSLLIPGLYAAGTASTQSAAGPAVRELKADVIIVGGGLGGCAAAPAAARWGLSVILTEETDWIGGQLTAQAVPPDENPWVESFGCTQSYQALRQGIRSYYARNY